MELYGFEKSDPALFDLAIVQKEADGGRTDSAQIDRIQERPEAESLIVSGLDQKAFEYLIRRFGRQFKTISFWKNKLVCDLSPLSGLPELQYVHFFFNQRAPDLWDMRDNVCLRGLTVCDFTKLHSIARVASAPALEYFSIGDRVWPGMEIESLRPLTRSSVSHFTWWGNRVLDRDDLCLAQSGIRELDLLAGGFRLEELARLNAKMPGVRGTVTRPYSESTVIRQGEETTWYLLCKGRKRLLKGRDEEKLKAYLEEFDRLVKRYRSETG